MVANACFQAFGNLGQEDLELETSLGSTAGPTSKEKKTKTPQVQPDSHTENQ